MKLAIKVSLLYVLYFLAINKGYAQNQGLAAIDSMKKVLPHPATDSNQLKTVYRIADAYTHINADSSMAYTLSGLAQAKKIAWKKGIAAFYNSLGNLNSNNGSFDKAIYYYKAGFIINKSIGNKTNMASNLINIGSVYQRQGNGIKALTYHFQALPIAETVKAYQLISTIYSNVADIYFEQKDYKKTIAYYSKALKLHQQQHNDNGIADIYNSIGNVYLEQKSLKAAGTSYTRSLSLYRLVGNRTGEATVLSQMGLLYENDKDKKLAYLFDAQRIFDAMNPLYSVSITNLGNIGGTYADILMDNSVSHYKGSRYIPHDQASLTKKAEYYLNKAIAYSREVGDIDNLSFFTNHLAQLQEKSGKYQQALQNYKTSRSISDSLYSQESKNKIAELEAQHNFQKKEDGYKQQQQISQLKMKQTFLYAALLVLLVSSVLIYLLNRSRISGLRLRNELQKKAAEEQTRELLHRNKLSESELKAIRAQMNPHFIFNVLNSIESYILENDSKTASRLVQKFASLSRLILENSTQSLVSAEREWKALQLYTELEAMRFNHQFTYSFFVDPLLDLSVLMLPPMLVQPLIENAIHHGLRSSPEAGNAVNIRLEQTSNQLSFTVEDNGIGMDKAEEFKNFNSIKSKSIGLSAIRERIDIINVMNGESRSAFNIRTKNKDEGAGTIAILTLPKISR